MNQAKINAIRKVLDVIYSCENLDQLIFTEKWARSSPTISHALQSGGHLRVELFYDSMKRKYQEFGIKKYFSFENSKP